MWWCCNNMNERISGIKRRMIRWYCLQHLLFTFSSDTLPPQRLADQQLRMTIEKFYLTDIGAVAAVKVAIYKSLAAPLLVGVWRWNTLLLFRWRGEKISSFLLRWWRTMWLFFCWANDEVCETLFCCFWSCNAMNILCPSDELYEHREETVYSSLWRYKINDEGKCWCGVMIEMFWWWECSCYFLDKTG